MKERGGGFMTCVAHQVPDDICTHCECGEVADGYADRTHGWCKGCLGGKSIPSFTAFLRIENIFVLQRPLQRE